MENISQIILELTKRCNLNCSHCYRQKDFTKELTTDEWLTAIDKLAQLDIKHCVLLGGSPEMCNNFYDILQYCIDNFKEVSIETNGTISSKFSEYDCNVSISFEYANRSKNDAIRGKAEMPSLSEGVVDEIKSNYGEDVFESVKEDYDKTEGSVFELAYMKLKKTVNNKVCRFTLYSDSDITLSMVMAEKNNANSVFVPLIPVGHASNLMNKVPTSTKLLSFYQDCYNFNKITKMNHTIQQPQYVIYEYERELSQHKSFKGVVINPSKRLIELNNSRNKCLSRGRICGAGITRLFITSEGTVTPCPFIPQFKFGHIIQDDLQTILLNRDKFNKYISEYPISNKCMKCIYVSLCRGGCLATYIEDYNKMGVNCPLKDIIKIK